VLDDAAPAEAAVFGIALIATILAFVRELDADCTCGGRIERAGALSGPDPAAACADIAIAFRICDRRPRG